MWNHFGSNSLGMKGHIEELGNSFISLIVSTVAGATISKGCYNVQNFKYIMLASVLVLEASAYYIFVNEI